MPTFDERIEAAKALAGYSEGPWEIVTDLPAIAIAAGKYRVVQTPNQNNYGLGISGFNNATLIAAAPDLHRLVLDLAAENERLREALEKIAGADEVTLMCDPLGSSRIARAALASEPRE